MAIQVIFFDVGGVLIRFDETDARIDAWDAGRGVPPGTTRSALWGSEAWRQVETGKISIEDYDRQITEALGLESAAALQTFYDAVFADEEFDARVFDLAMTLRERYRVAILSNADLRQRAIFRDKFNIDTGAAFDDHIISAEVGLRKPDPAIYRLACERMAVEPQEAVMIDDRPENIEAAQQLDMHGIVHTDYPALRQALSAVLEHPV